ncbi:MAG: class I adenylate-forming enzyme family protein [Burkholderiales bacterium]
MNASEPIRRNARVLPDQPAFVRNDGSAIAFAALERDVDRVAHRLRALGCGPGDAADVACDDLYQYLCVTFGLARVGAAVGAGALAPGMVTLGIGTTAAARAVGVDELLAAGGATPTAPEPIHDDPQAVFAYCPSSGTTGGVPKVVAFTHDLMWRRIVMRMFAAPAIPGSRHVSMVGVDSVFGWQRNLRTLWSGSTLVEPNLHGDDIAPWLVRTGVTSMTLSPMGLRRLLECLPPEGVRCALQLCEVGGAAVSAALDKMAAERLGATLLASYGSTETGTIASAPVSVLGGRSGAVGYPFPGVRVEIVDDDDRVLPAGSPGRVRVRTAAAATGYVDNAEAAARTFRDGWVYPSDHGVLDADGLLCLVGRVDDVINLGGVKVAPQEIEVILQALADLREAAVYGVPAADGTITLCAAVVPNGHLDTDALHQRCVARFGRYAPAVIVRMSALPRNAMGKILRTELAQTTAALLRKPPGP